jgi:chromosome segregation ATPase
LAVVTVAGLAGLYLYTQRLDDRLAAMQAGIESSLRSQGDRLQALNGRLEQSDARHQDLQGEFTVAKQRLGMTQSELQKARQTAAELARQQKEASEQISSQLGQLQQETVATKGSLGNLSSDVTGVKGEVKSTKAELDATRSQLQRVVGDLGIQSDLVAHNRDEIAELRLRGERDYIEFDLKKTNRPQRFGAVQLQLKKTDPKRQKYTLSLVADDKTIEKKDKTVFEPVQFYQEGFRAPTEIVVNKIDKDRVVGYVSVPKKQEARTAMKASS